MSGRDLGYAPPKLGQDARQTLLAPGRITKGAVATALAAGLIMLAYLACASSIARADVDMTGRVEKVPTATGKAKPLATSINGDYRCADPYSVIGNRPFYFAIGNCVEGWDIEAVAYSGENSVTHEHSYGGYIGSAYSYCGWIDTRFPVERLNNNSNSACKNGSSNATELEESSFMEKYDESNSSHDGNWVVNKVSCPEYANYRPWSTNNVEKELIRTVPAYALGGEHIVEHEPALKWRYVTKYASTDGTGKYAMVRDDRITGGGEGNWVFVPLSCLRSSPSELPENGGERLPPSPTATTGGNSSVTSSSASLAGSINPNGVETHYYIEWGKEASKPYESFAPTPYPGEGVGSGKETVNRSVTATGLTANTVYYYRLVASSPTGTSEGSTGSFKTLPNPPVATTQAATDVGETQATLNGEINPNGSATRYYFQYGTEETYGSKTAEVEDGSGSEEHAVTPATIGSLAENTMYHFRIVATNAIGATSYGKDFTFTTPFIRTTPVAMRDASNGTQWVYYVGKEHSIWQWTWNGSSWFNSHPGGSVAANSNLSVTRSPGTGEQWVYSIGGATGTSVQQEAWSGSKWGPVTLGGEAAPNTSPAALREEGTGYQWVYYAGKESSGDNSVWEFTWNGSTWVNGHPGGFIASNTSPAFVRSSSSGDQWVYYVGGGDGAIWQAAWNGKEWIQTRVGGEVAPNTSPVVVREEGTGYQWLYYVNKANGAVEEFTWNGSTWTTTPTEVGGFVEANSSLAVVREASTGYQWVYYVGGGDGAVWEWTWNGSTWVSSRPGSSVASNTSPAVVQPAGGYQWVYYQGSKDPIMQLFWSGSTWGEIAP
jgi:hypothetical protein